LELSKYFQKLIFNQQTGSPPEGSALGPEPPGLLPCYATGPTFGASAPTERICYILNNVRSDNRSRMWKPLSPVKLMLTFPRVILRKNKIEQRLLEESIVYLIGVEASKVWGCY